MWFCLVLFDCGGGVWVFVEGRGYHVEGRGYYVEGRGYHVEGIKK